MKQIASKQKRCVGKKPLDDKTCEAHNAEEKPQKSCEGDEKCVFKAPLDISSENHRILDNGDILGFEVRKFKTGYNPLKDVRLDATTDADPVDVGKYEIDVWDGQKPSFRDAGCCSISRYTTFVQPMADKHVEVLGCAALIRQKQILASQSDEDRAHGLKPCKEDCVKLGKQKKQKDQADVACLQLQLARGKSGPCHQDWARDQIAKGGNWDTYTEAETSWAPPKAKYYTAGDNKGAFDFDKYCDQFKNNNDCKTKTAKLCVYKENNCVPLQKAEEGWQSVVIHKDNYVQNPLTTKDYLNPKLVSTYKKTEEEDSCDKAKKNCCCYSEHTKEITSKKRSSEGGKFCGRESTPLPKKDCNLA